MSSTRFVEKSSFFMFTHFAPFPTGVGRYKIEVFGGFSRSSKNVLPIITRLRQR